MKKLILDYLRVAGISQAELARRAGISIEEMSRYMNGHREPRLATIRKISEASGIALHKLIDAIDPPVNS
jgi:transcriptional regulator with XRE-family HTH domain